MSLASTCTSSTCTSLVCTCMSVACHSYVVVCHSYITCKYPSVIRMSLVCIRMSSVCHSYILVFHPYVTRMYSFAIRMSLVCGFTMKRFKLVVFELRLYPKIKIINQIFYFIKLFDSLEKQLFRDFLKISEN